MKVTKEYIESYLSNNSRDRCAHFLGRALVVMFRNQTADEQATNETREHNGVGFTGADAHSGTISAKYYLKHGTLQDWQIERWLKRNANGTMRIAKYWRQLDEAAKLKTRGA